MVDRFEAKSDEELLTLGTSNPGAFGVFYDRYEGEMLGFFMRSTGRSDLAADLTAEVFASALSGLQRFDPSLGAARSWLYGIARHELADTWARKGVDDKARRHLGLEPMMLEDDALHRIDRTGDRNALAFLAGLPEDQRRAIQGRVLEERDYAELAANLACSESVVRKRVSRGLNRLRRLLEDSYELPT
jgi:RNA polymerase sigma factor (sigma-70 family)